MLEPVVILRVVRQMLVQEKAAGLNRHDVFEGMVAHDTLMEAFDWGVPVGCLSVIVA